MTITTTSAGGCGRRPVRTAGFTLVEVLIAATISGFILAGVLSAFLMMGRSEVNAYNYVGMESEARQGLERFGEDARMAFNIRWTSAQDVTLWMDRNGTAATNVRYYYDTTTGSSTYHSLVRYGPDRVTGTVQTKAIVHNVQTDMSFVRWTKGSTPAAANGDPGTNQLQLRLTIKNTAITAVAATNLVVSARYILRNK